MLEPPAILNRIEFSRVVFLLEFKEGCTLGMEALLQLRRELRGLGKAGICPVDEVEAALSPSLSSDPVARRRYQRPGPAFVFHPPPARLPGRYAPGDRLALPVLFLGRGMQQAASLTSMLVQLGHNGMRQGVGAFRLVGIQAEDPAGTRCPLWSEGSQEESFAKLAPPILDARWWVERHPLAASGLEMAFLTPARLISIGRPMFRPSFGSLFPFVLRRVTSMVFAHCDLELDLEPRRLIDLACGLEERNRSLRWADWRTLQGTRDRQDLGGVVGRVTLLGPGLEEIYWILVLGSLLNIGKGAAFAGGHFQLHAAPGAGHGECGKG